MAVTALKPPTKARAPARPDPLLAALIAKLPGAGSSWPAEDRTAWLKMMAMAFNVVYAGEAVEMPKFLMVDPAAATVTPPGPSLTQPSGSITTDPPFVKMAPHPFYIGTDGIARDHTGKQILPSDVIGPIYDRRGEMGDLGTIMWADGKMGVAGLQLEIAAA